MEEDEMEQLQESLENDYEIGTLIKDKIVPKAVSWFTGLAISPEEEYDDEDDEDDEGAYTAQLRREGGLVVRSRR